LGRLISNAVGFLRQRIFFKHMLATLLIGGTLNAVVLFWYKDYKESAQTDQVAAEMAAIANRIARPAADLIAAGNASQARGLLAVFAGFPYVVCADLSLENGGAPAVSWPVIGCAKINKPGFDIEVTAPTGGGEANMLVRIDPVLLASELRTEVGVVLALGLLGGFSLILAGAGAFIWLISRPLRQMLHAIERFERDDDPTKISYTSEDEIGKVITSYNMMLDREVERVTAIRDAHRQIVDSVTYATRIQQCLLPTASQCAEAFDDFAVIWEPRDLVGGDIYWVRTTGPTTTVAVIDCTGHGVPGGFMTMLAIATLERLYFEDETLGPAEALSRLSDLTRMLLSQDGDDATSNDGMDAAICQINALENTAVFSGARLSLLTSSNENTMRIKGDRMSVGYPDTPSLPQFIEHQIHLEDDTMLMITTDGLIDQLGGAKRLAFGYQHLLPVITKHSDGTAQDLLFAVKKAFQDYSADEERLDDLTVLAFRAKREGA